MHSENPTPGANAPADDSALDAANLGAELEQLRSALGNLREEALRERAELDNQRKRLARDVDQARRFANERLLSELLPVLDSLEATRRQLLKVGADHGMSQIDPQGETFDPAWHQAVSQVPAPDAAPGTVVQVFQRGYVLNDRLLRPALVAVAAG